MDAWLLCSVGPGQFSDEFAVVAQSSTGTEFSLFVPKQFVQVEGKPSRGSRLAGKLLVEVFDKAEDQFLVGLPAEAFGNGRTVTVTSEQVEPIPSKQRYSDRSR